MSSPPPAISAALSLGGAVAASTGPRGFPLILAAAPGAAAAALVAAAGGAGAWAAANQPELEALLSRYGAVLFRGLVRSDDAADAAAGASPAALAFSAFVRGFSGARWADLPYADSLSYAVRTEVCDRVCTTNEGRLGGMVWHHEQAQAPRFPRAVFFFCEVPAEPGCGGGTGISPSAAVHDALAREHPAFLAACAAKGLVYRARLPPRDGAGAGSGVGRSWRSFWRCAKKAEAEARMRELGYSWQWEAAAGGGGGGGGEEEEEEEEEDVLRMVTPVLPAVVAAPPSATLVFFNQAIAQVLSNAKWFLEVSDSAKTLTPEEEAAKVGEFLTLGDGSPVDLAALRFAAQVADENAYDIEWQRNDVALLDNYLVMHARRAWAGDGPRKVLASLVNEPERLPTPGGGAK